MSTSTIERGNALQEPALKARLQELRRIDNWRNLLAVLRTWVFLAVAIGGAVSFDIWRSTAGHHWILSVPVFALAVICIGAGQHQLTALGHEASHHILLNNRLANELVSDWLCMYPCFTTTHHYRLQHLAHHQFVNDPERDPNFGQLLVNGHWHEFPMTKREFWKQFVQQFLPWNLINYLRATAAYNSLPTESNPYISPTGRASSVARIVGVLYFGLQLAAMIGLTLYGNNSVLLAVTGGLWLVSILFFLAIPTNWYMRSRIHPTVSMRYVTVMRLTFMTALFLGVAMLALQYGPRVLAYFLLLWGLPFFTSFSFFMMMRQLVQHANADRGWLTNTRVMLMNKLIRDSILPYGQDYHLPHHLYATVPHYNLRKLHETLMTYPEYCDQVQVVAGAVVPRPGHEYPTLVEMLGPEFAPAARHAAHVDNSVLDNVEVEEKEAIIRAAAESRATDY